MFSRLIAIPLDDIVQSLAAAERIGYPVMLKASEGGGGKGIRLSQNAEELKTNFVQVRPHLLSHMLIPKSCNACA